VILIFLQKSSNAFPFTCLLCSAWSAQTHTGGHGYVTKRFWWNLQQNKSDKLYFISSQYNAYWTLISQRTAHHNLIVKYIFQHFLKYLMKCKKKMHNWNSNVNKKQQYCSCCYWCHCLFPQCHWTFMIVCFKIKGYETIVVSLLKYIFDVSMSQQQLLNQDKKW
jgi:hypothetical protein